VCRVSDPIVVLVLSRLLPRYLLISLPVSIFCVVVVLSSRRGLVSSYGLLPSGCIVVASQPRVLSLPRHQSRFVVFEVASLSNLCYRRRLHLRRSSVAVRSRLYGRCRCLLLGRCCRCGCVVIVVCAPACMHNHGRHLSLWSFQTVL